MEEPRHRHGGVEFGRNGPPCRGRGIGSSTARGGEHGIKHGGVQTGVVERPAALRGGEQGRQVAERDVAGDAGEHDIKLFAWRAHGREERGQLHHA